MRNTLVILTMRYAFVNDGNQPIWVHIVLVELSDNNYNDLDTLVWFCTKIIGVDNCWLKCIKPKSSDEAFVVQYLKQEYETMSELKRVYNFNPGPGVLPLEVLQEAQAELLNFKGTGMSVMEISHRSKE